MMTTTQDDKYVINELLRRQKYPFYSKSSLAVSGKIKLFPEDFVVTEIPLYEPSGKGDHIYFCIEKQNMTTNGAAERIARALGIHLRDIGIAGQKDASAITRQTLSVEHVAAEQIESLDIPGIRILWTRRHSNKLKMGHLWGNRFEIRLRETTGTAVTDVAELLTWLEKNGIPNYFGSQRFGSRGDTWMVGRALLKNDYEEALRIVLGYSTPELEGEGISIARKLFDDGKFAEAAAAWPRGFGDNAKLCRTFERTGGHYKKTMLSAGKKALIFYVSAFQSELFNRVLAARIEANAMTTMVKGDVAWKHDSGACFDVEDAAAETLRAEAGEISPTGPLYGKKMKPPTGSIAELEQSILSGEQITLSHFSNPGPFKSPGGRRPLRIFPRHCQVLEERDAFGVHLKFSFSLPAGAYATTLLREICKGKLIDASQRKAVSSGDSPL